MKKIITISLVFLAISVIPSSFAWDGMMALDADKRNVGLGQIITYTGYIYGEYPVEDEIVFITVSEKETKQVILKMNAIPKAGHVKYFENTAWPFTFQVNTMEKEFSSKKTYVVEATYIDKSTKLDFFIQSNSEPTCLEILNDNPIIVLTDKEKYDSGDTISISGCLSPQANTKGINITVYDPQGNKIGTSTLTPNPDRTFSENFIIDERFGIDGTYSVEVDAGGLYSSTKSFVVPEFGMIVLPILFASIMFIVVLGKFSKINL